MTEGREGEGGKECTSSGARKGIELNGSHIKKAAIWFRFFFSFLPPFFECRNSQVKLTPRPRCRRQVCLELLTQPPQRSNAGLDRRADFTTGSFWDFVWRNRMTQFRDNNNQEANVFPYRSAQVFDDVFVGSPAVLPESAPVRKLNTFFQIEFFFSNCCAWS